MMEGNAQPIIRKHGKVIDAEWLFENCNAFENTLSTLLERLNQLSRPLSEYQVITGMQLASRLSGDPPGNHAAPDSKTEKAMMKYESILAAEKREIAEEIQTLEGRVRELQDLLRLHRAIMEGLTDQEKWLAEHYYRKGQSLDAMVRELEEQNVYLSKSTLRRRKIQLIEKAQRLLYALYCEKNGGEDNQPRS